jgi:hypothetical protein
MSTQLIERPGQAEAEASVSPPASVSRLPSTTVYATESLLVAFFAAFYLIYAAKAWF